MEIFNNFVTLFAVCPIISYCLIVVVIGARVWLIMGFLLLFGGLIAASWILFGAYVVPGRE